MRIYCNSVILSVSILCLFRISVYFVHLLLCYLNAFCQQQQQPFYGPLIHDKIDNPGELVSATVGHCEFCQLCKLNIIVV